MAFEVPRNNEVYEITDEGDYYYFRWSPNDGIGYSEEGPIGQSVCKPPPHAGTGDAPDHEAFQYSMPTAFLGSQAAYLDPVIAVKFTIIQVSVASQWQWHCVCGGGCELGENRREVTFEPAMLDEDGNPCVHTFLDRQTHHHEFHMGELPVGTWPDITLVVSCTGVHSYATTCTVSGYARKTPTIPPDPEFEIPPEIDFPLTPPCFDAPPGRARAGGNQSGRVRLCEDC